VNASWWSNLAEFMEIEAEVDITALRILRLMYDVGN
jgi:hypothetical protein